MIRIIARTDNAGMAANVGGAVFTELKSFDVNLPELEAYLKEATGTYMHAQVIGVEILPVQGGPSD